MTINWDDVAHWGARETCIHLSEDGSDIPQCPKEEMA